MTLRQEADALLAKLHKRKKAFVLVFASEEHNPEQYEMFDAGNITQQERHGVLLHALANPVNLDMPNGTETEQ